MGSNPITATKKIMKNKIKETIQIDKIISVVCDVCKKEYKEEWDIQEFHYIDFIGGYYSIFGDGAHITYDICQRCLKKIIEKNINISEN